MLRAIQQQITSNIKALQHMDAYFGDVQMQKHIELIALEIPQTITLAVKLVTMDVAGIKFKTGQCTSGRQYLVFAEIIIDKTVKQFSNMVELIICEEKYSHEPHLNVPLGYKDSPKRLHPHSIWKKLSQF